MRLKPLLAAAGALALLSACETYGPGYGGGGVAIGYGPVAAVGYDGYYDDYYGPFYDGYWGADGAYYYRGSDHDRWHKDTGHHFDRQAARTNMHPVHGIPHDTPQRGGAREGGEHHPE